MSNMYRGDHEAALARIDALEHELAAANATIEQMKDNGSDGQLWRAERECSRLRTENSKLHQQVGEFRQMREQAYVIARDVGVKIQEQLQARSKAPLWAKVWMVAVLFSITVKLFLAL